VAESDDGKARPSPLRVAWSAGWLGTRRPLPVGFSSADAGSHDQRNSQAYAAEKAPYKAIAAVWDGVPVQRCTVHKHRNLLAHAPERLHEEITADYNDMIYAATPEEIAACRKAFLYANPNSNQLC
jgi:hypothetical protein